MSPIRRGLVLSCVAATLLGAPAGAQTPASNGKSPDWQVAAAVLALPEPMRVGAEVRAWSGDTLVVLRPGSNGLICLADRPEQEGFAAACYHDSLEPFMERGRELTRQGVAGARRDEIRWDEIRAGTLAMPPTAMVYNLRHGTVDFDPASFDPATAARLLSLYIRDATEASTGVSARPSAEPWLMHAGTPSAHIMIALPPKPAAGERR